MVVRTPAGLGISRDLYEKGEGLPQDYAAAVNWYRKAAEQGYDYAQAELGAMYNNGRGVTQDYAVAASWYRKVECVEYRHAICTADDRGPRGWPGCHRSADHLDMRCGPWPSA